MRYTPLLIVVLAFSCTPQIEEVQSPDEESPVTAYNLILDGTAWELVAASRDGEVYEEVPADRMWFSNHDGVTIHSCNSCSGLYSIEESQVTFLRMACTRMACRPDQFELETMLGETARFSLDDNTLVVENASYRLHFNAIEMPGQN